MKTKTIFMLAIVAALPSVALAHSGHLQDGNVFAQGFMHPIGGFDHVLAMLAVGLWAATADDRRAIRALPVAFVAAMFAGFALGAHHIPLPAVEPMILASSILLGLAVALTLRPALSFALPVVAAFGVMHGHAHGAEGLASGLLAYAAGFGLATMALHMAGIGLGRLGATRLLGGATALAGAALVVIA